MRTQLLRLSVGLAVTALMATVGVVQAAGKKGTNSPAHAQLVAEIHNTRTLLQTADHDYDGFRAKAVHELGKAMHALHPKHKHTLPKARVGGNNETQVKSDAQLAQARKQIHTIMSQLSTVAATPATATAMQHLQNAHAHLSTALKIR